MAAPFLLLPSRLTPLALFLVPIAWLLRRLRLGRNLRTGADAPIATLMFMTLVALFASFDLAYSLPKLYGILLGVLAFYVVAGAPPRPGSALALAVVLALGALVVSAVGLVGTNWFEEKLFGLGAVTSRLPSLAGRLPRSVLDRGPGGIHPNEVAGTLALLIPVPLSVLLAGSSIRSAWLRRLAAIALAVSLLVLILTQSRSGWTGFAAAVACLAARRQVRRHPLRDRRWAVVALLLVAVASALLVAALGGPAGLLDRFDRAFAQTGSGVSRLELWSRTWLMIQDFPFTGIGLNAFPFVLDALYPALLSSPGELVAHAHDLYLQVAIDLGIPGLAAFLALFCVTARSWWLARAAADPLWRALANGAALGLLGFCVYGLTDAIALGAKPGLALWLLLGTIALAERRARRLTTSPG